MSYSITKNDYFDKSQPAKSDEIYNSVTIKTQPLIESEETTEVYRSNEAVLFDAYETKVIDCVYNSIPVMDAVVTMEDASAGLVFNSVAEEDYHAWGCTVRIVNTLASEGSVIISIRGTALQVMGEEDVEDHDDASIVENGTLKYEYPVNHLIQTRAMAEDIIAGLLLSYKDFRKDVSLNWRGDPALELGDKIEAPIYQRNAIDVRGTFYIFKQKLDFDGALKSVTDGRKTV